MQQTSRHDVCVRAPFLRSNRAPTTQVSRRELCTRPENTTHVNTTQRLTGSSERCAQAQSSTRGVQVSPSVLIPGIWLLNLQVPLRNLSPACNAHVASDLSSAIVLRTCESFLCFTRSCHSKSSYRCVQSVDRPKPASSFTLQLACRETVLKPTFNGRRVQKVAQCIHLRTCRDRTY
jgi:hypothetical protein